MHKLSESKCHKCKSKPCCCPIENENEIQNNPTNTNTFNPTFNATITIPTIPTAFGSLYGDGTIRQAVSGTNVQFDIPGPAFGTVPDAATDTITVLSSGVFEITIFLQVLPSEAESANFVVQRNMIDITGSQFEITLGLGLSFISTTIGKTVQASLIAGDVLRVAVVGSAGSVDYQLAAFTVVQIQ